jgi:acyl-coenzyme A synthetase/AMP-(fatty) acid ligase
VQDDGQRVRFLGRLNGCINVGGDKVHPETVEQALTAHAAVFAAAVRGRRSPYTGALVEAAVLLQPGIDASPALREALLAHCRQRLARHAVPAVLRFVTDWQSNAAGKQERKT